MKNFFIFSNFNFTFFKKNYLKKGKKLHFLLWAVCTNIYPIFLKAENATSPDKSIKNPPKALRRTSPLICFATNEPKTPKTIAGIIK